MIKRMSRWWKGIKNHFRQQIKENGTVYTVVFWGVVFIVFMLSTLLLIALFCDPFLQFLMKRYGAETALAIIQTIGSGILGCLAVLGVMIASRRAKSANETAKAANETAKAANITAANQVKATGNQIKATKAANITTANQVKAIKNQIAATKEAKEVNIEKAFATAITQLGSKSSSVRLGCIYSLYGIAKEYKERRENISATLCMHVKEITKENDYQDTYKARPSGEIRELLNILAKPDKEDNFIWGDIRKDFSGAYLTGANLNYSSLKKANLNNAQLQGAHLGEAQLQGAYLGGAQLQGAYLGGAQLQGAYLRRTQLQGAYLWRTKLQGAYLEDAQLQGAELRGAQLQGANLRRTQLQGAYLRGAQLQGAIASEERTSFQMTSVRGFEEWINKCKNKNSDLKEVIFSGDLDAQKSQKIINIFQSLHTEEVIDKRKYEEMKEIIERHKGKAKNYEVPPTPPNIKPSRKNAALKRVS